MGFPGGSVVKNLPAKQEMSRSETYPGGRNGSPLQSSSWGTPWTEQPGSLYGPHGCRELDMT